MVVSTNQAVAEAAGRFHAINPRGLTGNQRHIEEIARGCFVAATASLPAPRGVIARVAKNDHPVEHLRFGGG